MTTRRRSPSAEVEPGVKGRRGAKAAAQEAQNKYDAAGNGRRIATWKPGNRGPKLSVEGTERMRDRTRDSIRNDWAAATWAQRWSTTLIGVAITPRWKNASISALWSKFVPYADADCVLDAYGLQTLGVRAWFDGGEVFLRRRRRPLGSELATPVQFQLIESDFLPMWSTDVWPGLPRGNRIEQGIERTRYGKRVAYWFYREHPGDQPGSPNASMLVRVPASEVSHIYEPKRPGQLRGVSEASAMLTRLRNAGTFEDIVLDRQALANLFVGFIKRQIPNLTAEAVDPLTGLPRWYDKTNSPMISLESGTLQELVPGEEMVFANPPEAGTTYSDYMRTTALGTAAGGGLPYELLTGDIKDVSDRSLRVVINEFRRFARQRQWQVVIPMLCNPMARWWAEAEVLAGSLSMSLLEEAASPKWSPEGWEYIHPTQDAEGKKILLEAGLTSRARVIGERGDDVEEIDAERAEDKKRADKLGISPPVPQPAGGAADDAKKKPEPSAFINEAFFAAQMRLIEAQTVAASREPAAPVPAAPTTIHVHIPPAEKTQAAGAGFTETIIYDDRGRPSGWTRTPVESPPLTN